MAKRVDFTKRQRPLIRHAASDVLVVAE
jgi:hypothetical protein